MGTLIVFLILYLLSGWFNGSSKPNDLTEEASNVTSEDDSGAELTPIGEGDIPQMTQTRQPSETSPQPSGPFPSNLPATAQPTPEASSPWSGTASLALDEFERSLR